MAIPVEIPASVIDPRVQPNFGRRRTVRADINPMDRSTVVSILPKENPPEYKHTLMPSEYKIPYGTYDKPGILIVGSASWWADINPEQPLVEISVGSPQVANSIVQDFSNGYLGCDMGDARPGLFWIPGCQFDKSGNPSEQLTVEWIKRDYKAQLDLAKAKQDNWFRVLVKFADIGWAKSNNSPLSVDDNMRMAAKELGLDREWISTYKAMEMIRCLSCGELRNPIYPTCKHCKWVDPTHPRAKDIKFAAQG